MSKIYLVQVHIIEATSDGRGGYTHKLRQYRTSSWFKLKDAMAAAKEIYKQLMIMWHKQDPRP